MAPPEIAQDHIQQQAHLWYDKGSNYQNGSFMSNSNEGQSDQSFSLVSLEGGGTAKKAASTYNSFEKKAAPSKSGLDFNEDQPPAPPAPAAPPKKSPPSKEKKTPPKAVTPAPDSEGKIDQSIDDIVARLDEFRKTFSHLLSNLSQAGKGILLVAVTPLIPILNRLLKLMNLPILFINRLTKKINEKMTHTEHPSKAATGTAANNEAEAEDALPPPSDPHATAPLEPPPPSPAAKKCGFSDMMELNIAFTDNMKKQLYKKNPSRGTGRLGAMEEELIMGNAIIAIKECAEFTMELPPPTTGIYANQSIYDIMSNVTAEDVGIFLSFVKTYPGKYIGKEWKISETFATWLINNAPTG